MSDLEKQLDDISKDLRMWATWRLKARERNLDGEPISTTWDRMSQEDQEFNLTWARLYVIVRNGSLKKLKRIVEYAEMINDTGRVNRPDDGGKPNAVD